MKKIILLVTMLYLCIAMKAQRTYTFKFDRSDFRFETQDGIMSISTAKELPFYLEDIEKPALPYFSYRILRPSSMTASNYQVRYEKELLYENISIERNAATCPTNVSTGSQATVRAATKSSEGPVVWCNDNVGEITLST